MAISMHSAAMPVFKQMLGSLSAILGKAAAHAEARKIDPAVLLAARLAPDMLPLTKQVQIASDMSKLGIARLSGYEAPKFPDTETTIAELQDRITHTLEFLDSVPAGAVDGSEEKEIAFTAGGTDMRFRGQAYLMHWMIPNVIFHVATAYDILRHNGVELGKRDFLGSF